MDFSQNPIIEAYYKTIEKLGEYKTYIIYGIIFIAIFVLSFWGYAYYKNYSRAVAHKDFIAALKCYDGVVGVTKYDDSGISFSSENEKWQQTAKAFEEGYRAHRGSELAPFFLAFQSESLLKCGKRADALTLLRQAINLFSDKNIRDIYKIKLALMLLDGGAKDVELGLNELKALSTQSDSAVHERVLYHLGLYYWNQKKFNDAKGYWQLLLSKYGSYDPKKASVYAEEIKEKLELLNPETL
jgi:predicted negative regulator of RcsB-dependent stress response